MVHRVDKKRQLLGIATRLASHAPMNEMSVARITTREGVNGDARGKPGRRQVTVMTRSGWEAACSELGVDHLPWTARRANLLVDGVELRGKIGYDLRVGDAVLTVTGETRPCEVMNQAYPGLMEALKPEWRGGVTCCVTRSGEVAIGCEVVLSRRVSRQVYWIMYLCSQRFIKRGRAIVAGVARRLPWKKDVSLSHQGP